MLGYELKGELLKFKKNCSFIADFNFQSFYYFFSSKVLREQKEFIDNCKVKLKLMPESLEAQNLNSILSKKGLFEDNVQFSPETRKFIKELDESNSIHLMLKAYWAYTNNNEGAGYRYIRKAIYFDPWEDARKWGILTKDTNSESASKNFNQLLTVLKSYISNQDVQMWKILVMKLNEYLPDRFKKESKVLTQDSLSLNQVRQLSVSALYGKPYFFLWIHELSNRSSYKELDEYLKHIEWKYWVRAPWTIPYYFELTPTSRKAFIKYLSELKNTNLELYFRILENRRFQNLKLVKNQKAYPGFRAERKYYIEQLASENYLYNLFKLIQLGDLDVRYLR